MRLKGDVRLPEVASARACFNSKLVRLKARLRHAFDDTLNRFQFQTGAIKRTLVLLTPIATLKRFNSKLVRLKGDDGEIHHVIILVSIPNWCD